MSARSRTSSPADPHDHGRADAEALAERFGGVVRSLQAEHDTLAMLDEVVLAAVQLVPGAYAASVDVVAGRREVVAGHGSNPLAEKVDLLQTDTGQGPGLDAIWTQRVVRVPDMRSERRWPAFAGPAYALGVASMLSFQLRVEGDDLGALNLFGQVAGAFDDESERIGLLFASHVAVALGGARRQDHLTLALDGRDSIGQAKGILMERYSIAADRAFAVLLRISQTSHRKLQDVAHELVATRRLAGLGHRG